MIKPSTINNTIPPNFDAECIIHTLNKCSLNQLKEVNATLDELNEVSSSDQIKQFSIHTQRLIAFHSPCSGSATRNAALDNLDSPHGASATISNPARDLKFSANDKGNVIVPVLVNKILLATREIKLSEMPQGFNDEDVMSAVKAIVIQLSKEQYSNNKSVNAEYTFCNVPKTDLIAKRIYTSIANDTTVLSQLKYLVLHRSGFQRSINNSIIGSRENLTSNATKFLAKFEKAIMLQHQDLLTQYNGDPDQYIRTRAAAEIKNSFSTFSARDQTIICREMANYNNAKLNPAIQKSALITIDAVLNTAIQDTESRRYISDDFRAILESPSPELKELENDLHALYNKTIVHSYLSTLLKAKENSTSKLNDLYSKLKELTEKPLSSDDDDEPELDNIHMEIANNIQSSRNTQMSTNRILAMLEKPDENRIGFLAALPNIVAIESTLIKRHTLYEAVNYIIASDKKLVAQILDR